MTRSVTTKTFPDEVVGATEPVLLDFYADWCMPCQMMAAVLEEFDREQSDVKVCKVNIDQEPGLAKRFAILSIPTLVAMSGGEEIGRASGVQDKDCVRSLFAPVAQAAR